MKRDRINGRKEKSERLGSIRIPLSERVGGPISGKKPKYSRKVKHKHNGGREDVSINNR